MERERISIADMARQFSMSEEDLIEDIEMASMCGVPPYTPLELADLYIDEGYIHVGVNKQFDRRLELTASEAFGLTLLATAARDLPGFTRGRELRSAQRKLISSPRRSLQNSLQPLLLVNVKYSRIGRQQRTKKVFAQLLCAPYSPIAGTGTSRLTMICRESLVTSGLIAFVSYSQRVSSCQWPQ
jgi:predicted DNA-binding transcriptional regulator YafY